jgi:hypothetical protein
MRVFFKVLLSYLAREKRKTQRKGSKRSTFGGGPALAKIFGYSRCWEMISFEEVNRCTTFAAFYSVTASHIWLRLMRFALLAHLLLAYMRWTVFNTWFAAWVDRIHKQKRLLLSTTIIFVIKHSLYALNCLHNESCCMSRPHSQATTTIALDDNYFCFLTCFMLMFEALSQINCNFQNLGSIKQSRIFFQKQNMIITGWSKNKNICCSKHLQQKYIQQKGMFMSHLYFYGISYFCEG